MSGNNYYFDDTKIDKDYDFKYLNKSNNLNNVYNLEDEKIYKDPSKYDKYYRAINFSNLFNNKSIYVARPSQTSQQDSKPPQGKAYDASAMWSPFSLAGVVYEWNRGVIGISIDGEVVKESLDGTSNHHADATGRIADKLGSPIANTTAPFEAAISCNANGLLIFQSEGNNAFVYFPEEISEYQLSALKDIVAPRSNFIFSFTHQGNIYEDQRAQSVIEYASRICSAEKTGSKRA